MKIVHLVLGGDVAGGQLVALQLARAAREAGHHASFVSPTPGPFVELARGDGFEMRVLSIHSSLDLRAAARLARVLHANKIDVLHTHVMIEANVVARIAGRLARVPVLSHMHIENYLPQSRARRAVVRFLDNATARLCARIVAVSEDTMRALERQGYPSGRMVVVHNGVEVPPEAPTDAGDGIVEVARLAPVKGQRELIEAVALLEGARATLVGRDNESGGAYEKELRALAESLDVADRVDFAGYRHDAKELMASAALVVLPSWTEGLPMTVLEAMARSRAVVATPVGGTPEVVVDGETGVLVPMRDPQALAAAIDKLLRDPERRAQLGAAGRARVEAQFSLARTTARFLELYAEIGRRDSA
jgi:glycosyltransferase involved in cell wall biosynthesis